MARVTALMKGILYLGILVLTTIAINSCIEGIEVFSGASPSLVVDGNLTDQEGPHIIKLSFSREFNTPSNFNEVNTAKVAIVDDQGITEQLTLWADGQFRTSQGFKGIVGRSYQLVIALPNGKEYRSNWQKMPQPVNLFEGAYAIKRVERVSSEDIIYYENEVEFNVNFSDPVDQRNFYRWRYRGTFQFFECYVSSFDHEFLLLDEDSFFDGKEFDRYVVYSETIDNRFGLGYDGEIQCHSISEAVHKYWTEIKAQISNNGTIFDTPNYPIRGNVRSINDADELVLGLFGVSAVTKQHIFVDGGAAGVAFYYNCTPNPNTGHVPEPCVDCTKYRASSTRNKPEFWPK